MQILAMCPLCNTGFLCITVSVSDYVYTQYNLRIILHSNLNLKQRLLAFCRPVAGRMHMMYSYLKFMSKLPRMYNCDVTKLITMTSQEKQQITS